MNSSEIVYISFEKQTLISKEISFTIRQYFESSQDEFKWVVRTRDTEENERTWRDEVNEAKIIICIISLHYDMSADSRNELFYSCFLNKPVVYVMLNKLKEFKYIGLTLMGKKFVKAYKDLVGFKEKSGEMFLEFQSLVNNFGKVTKKSKNTIESVSFNGNNYTTYIENVIEKFIDLAEGYQFYYYFVDWLNKEKKHTEIRIAILGDHKRGKSKLINAIFRKNLVKTDVKIPTDEIILIDYAKHGVDELKEVTLIDTPGVGSIFEDHDKKLINYLENNTIDSVIAVQQHTQTPSINEKNLFEHELLEKKLKYIVLCRYNYFKCDLDEKEQKDTIENIKNFFQIENDIYKVESKYDFNDIGAYQQSGIPELISALRKDFANKKIDSITNNFNGKIDNLVSFLSLNVKNLEEFCKNELERLKSKIKSTEDCVQKLLCIAREEELTEIKDVLNQSINDLDEDRINECYIATVAKLTELEIRFNDQIGEINTAFENVTNDGLELELHVKSIKEAFKSLPSKTKYYFSGVILFLSIIGAIFSPVAIIGGIGSIILYFLEKKNRKESFKETIKKIDKEFDAITNRFNEKKKEVTDKQNEFSKNFNKMTHELEKKINSNGKELDKIKKDIESFRSQIKKCSQSLTNDCLKTE